MSNTAGHYRVERESLLTNDLKIWHFGGNEFHSPDILCTKVRQNQIVLVEQGFTLYLWDETVWRVNLFLINTISR